MAEMNGREAPRGAARLLRRGLFAVAPVVAVLLLGQLATTPNIPTWYAGLDKPGFTPPNWVFAPVWTSLYALMAVAAWRLLGASDRTPGRALALWLFYLQLALNLAWSWMFFAAQSPLLGAINIIPQWIIIVGAIAASWRVDRVAAVCLAPLAVWVAYAAALNFGVLALNA